MADIPQEDLDYIKQVMDTLEAQKTSQNTTPATVQTTPAPIKLNLGGSAMEFTSQEDLEAKMNEVLNTAREYVQKSMQTQPAANVQSDEAPGFQMTQYAELMEAGKITEGIDYVLEHSKKFKEVNLKSQEAHGKLAAYEFRDKHPELTKLDPRVQGYIGQKIIEARDRYKLPLTGDGLDAAFVLAQRDDPHMRQAFNTAPVQNQQVPQNQHNPWAAPVTPTQPVAPNPHLLANGTVAPPPTFGRVGTSGQVSLQDIEDQMEDMSTEQLQELIKRGLAR